MQGIVDSAMDLFVADVAKGRGVSTSKVRNGMGNGRVLDAKMAKSAGLVDRIATFTDTVARVSRRRAEDVVPEVVTTNDVEIEAEVVDTAELEAQAEQARLDRLEVDLAKWQFNR